jgi:NAD(P)-dependent dehydrogenase (short-subunit alcohol dehydrogenase family)
MSGQLIGKTAIITGGTSGIGRRTVEIFAQEGRFLLVVWIIQHKKTRIITVRDPPTKEKQFYRRAKK